MASKLPTATVREAVEAILAESAEKKRNFQETIELQIGLKNYDTKKDKRFAGSVKLPHCPRPNMKVAILGNAVHVTEAEKLGVDKYDVDALKKFNKQKKPIKKFAKKYNAFLASDTIIKTIVSFLSRHCLTRCALCDTRPFLRLDFVCCDSSLPLCVSLPTLLFARESVTSRNKTSDIFLLCSPLGIPFCRKAPYSGAWSQQGRQVPNSASRE